MWSRTKPTKPACHSRSQARVSPTCCASPGSPYDIWRDTCLTNRENIAHALDRLAQAIEYLRTRLTSKDLEQEFKTANEIYVALRRRNKLKAGG